MSNAADLDTLRAAARNAARRLGALPEGAPECERHAARRESELADAALAAVVAQG